MPGDRVHLRQLAIRRRTGPGASVAACAKGSEVFLHVGGTITVQDGSDASLVVLARIVQSIRSCAGAAVNGHLRAARENIVPVINRAPSGTDLLEQVTDEVGGFNPGIAVEHRAPALVCMRIGKLDRLTTAAAVDLDGMVETGPCDPQPIAGGGVARSHRRCSRSHHFLSVSRRAYEWRGMSTLSRWPHRCAR